MQEIFLENINMRCIVKKSKIYLKIMMLMFIIVLLGGCGMRDQKIVNIGTWKTAQTVQPYYYNQFLGDKYNIEINTFSNPGDQKAALLAGELDLCGSTLVTAITAASQGEPIVIVSGLCNKCSVFVVGENTGINEVFDLKGKTIGYVPGTMHQVLLFDILNKGGIDPYEDVKLIRVDFFDMVQALSSGSIDAFCSGEPYPSMAIQNGSGKVLCYPYFEDSIGEINAVLITTRDKVKNDRDIIDAIINAHIKSTEYLEEDTSEWENAAEDFGVTKEVFDISKGNMELTWNIDSEFIEQTKQLAQKMYELGMIKEIPNIEAMFDLQFIDNYKNSKGETDAEI